MHNFDAIHQHSTGIQVFPADCNIVNTPLHLLGFLWGWPTNPSSQKSYPVCLLWNLSNFQMMDAYACQDFGANNFEWAQICITAYRYTVKDIAIWIKLPLHQSRQHLRACPNVFLAQETWSMWKDPLLQQGIWCSSKREYLPAGYSKCPLIKYWIINDTL